MLRQFGLICENLDGFPPFGAPNNCVFRSVPHTLGLSQTTLKQTATDSPFVQANETGWSADGAPGDGSLYCFAAGAIRQHFPKTLNRVEGTDFRLPTASELDALLAFQLSLGRQSTPNVQNFSFQDFRAQAGKSLFFDGMPTIGLNEPPFNVPANNSPTARSCSGCHTQAGSNNGVVFNQGRNRVTNVNLAPTAPVCRGRSLGFSVDLPGDGGFGHDVAQFPAFTENVACPDVLGGVNATFIGDTLSTSSQGGIGTIVPIRGSFNVPSLIEAADTGPFFHNNAFDTLEEAIGFYGSTEFNHANGNIGRAFKFQGTNIEDLGAFLRALNALENARSAIAYITQSSGLPPGQAKKLLQRALPEIEDGINVLEQGPPVFYPLAIDSFRQAQNALQGKNAKKTIDVNNALSALNDVSNHILNFNP